MSGISRHFVDVGTRRVHYRRSGSGPVVLMVHQSPHSSAEFEPLMLEWGASFTCIAPDSPGFGQSNPLEGAAECDDFARGLLDLLDVLGLARVAGYGVHSGGVILIAAMKLQPRRFTGLALSGYGVWTAKELAIFSERYLPPFLPTAYGEHLAWLWPRVLEQDWFFPWFAVTPEARVSHPHADVARADASAREMLDSGDAYRTGYGAVLRAPRDLPLPGSSVPPVLISSYPADSLVSHLERLSTLPPNWSATKAANLAAHQRLSRDFLQRHAQSAGTLGEDAADEGFVEITTAHFTGLIHWRGTGGGALRLHGPGRALELLRLDEGLAVDLPGHGLSSRWPGSVPTEQRPWMEVIDAVAEHFGCGSIAFEPLLKGEAALLFPELAPDRFGAYLTRAWGIVRAQHLFEPWYHVSAGTARAFDPEELAPERLALEHRALMRANAAREYQQAFSGG